MTITVEEQLLDLIGKYQKRKSLFKHVHTRPRAHTSDASKPEILGVRLRTLAHDTFFVQEVCNGKLFKLSEWLAWSIEAENTVALATGVRSLLEHVAVWNQVNHSLAGCLDRLENQSSSNKIDESLSRAEKLVKRAYYGSGGSNLKPLHVNDSLKLLNKSVNSQATVLYDFLCNFVHPNYGSNQLVSSGELGQGVVSVDASPIELQRFPNKCYLIAIACFDFFLREEHRLVTNLSILSDYAQRCDSPRAKIRKVFTVRAASPEGDGRTPETAFTFPKALTHLEEVRMVHQYLESRGIHLGEDGTIKELASITPLKECWHTPQGKIFFNYRHKPTIL